VRYHKLQNTFNACPPGFKMGTLMPKDAQRRTKHLTCIAGFNKFVVFDRDT